MKENENIDVFDVSVDNEYFATSMIPFGTPADVAENVAIMHAREIYPGLLGVSRERITAVLVNSIPPADIDPRAAKANTEQAGKKNIPKPTRRNVAPVPEEKRVGLVALRRLDGAIEEWADVRDFGYKYIIQLRKVFATMDKNHGVLEEGIADTKKMRYIAERYLFPMDDGDKVRSFDLAARFRKAWLSVNDVTESLALESQHYMTMRQNYNRKKKQTFVPERV